jgi:flagellar motor component MotA
LKILEKYINEQKKYSEQSKNQAIIMIGALANFLDNASQKKLINTFEKMLELLNSPSELIRQSICRVIPQLARFFEDKSRKFLDDHMKILKESQDDKVIRGSAYAVSGIIKGLGMSNMKDMDLLNTTHNHCFTKHADPMRKISGLYLYETLTISLGKVFEMNVEKILPDIILCISDPKEHVRRAAT